MSLWALLFFSVLFVIKANDKNFKDYEFPAFGKTDLENDLNRLWRKKLFLTKKDLKLNIKKDIIPRKSTKKKKKERKKRQILRDIILYFVEHYIEGLKSGSVEKEIEYPTDKKGRLYFEWEPTGYDMTIKFAQSPSPAKKLGIKKGWVVRKLNGIEITAGKRHDEDHKKLWQGRIKREKTVRAVFAIPKYSDIIGRQDVESMTLSELGQLLDIDFLGLSNVAKNTLQNEL